MRPSAPIRFAVTTSLVFSTMLCAQTRRGRHAKSSATISAAPAMPPAAPVAAAPAPPPTPAETPAELPARPAEVTYVNGMLTVAAGNSSLNQILRDISRETGMKITGGVADERVFGQYGPAPAAQVLNALLDGTGSNMLLVGSNGATPAELVLTPRSGGAPPPNPNAAGMEQSRHEDESPKEISRPAFPQNTANPPEDEPAPPAPAADDAQPKSPNGVKTPQDIFNELQKMRRARAQQQGTNQ